MPSSFRTKRIALRRSFAVLSVAIMHRRLPRPRCRAGAAFALPYSFRLPTTGGLLLSRLRYSFGVNFCVDTSRMQAASGTREIKEIYMSDMKVVRKMPPCKG